MPNIRPTKASKLSQLCVHTDCFDSQLVKVADTNLSSPKPFLSLHVHQLIKVLLLQGLTALMCATLGGHVKVVKELLLAKADPSLRRKVWSSH